MSINNVDKLIKNCVSHQLEIIQPSMMWCHHCIRKSRYKIIILFVKWLMIFFFNKSSHQILKQKHTSHHTTYAAPQRLYKYQFEFYYFLSFIFIPLCLQKSNMKMCFCNKWFPVGKIRILPSGYEVFFIFNTHMALNVKWNLTLIITLLQLDSFLF